MLDFEYHTGSTRAVFLIGKYAIKLPRLYSWQTFLQGFLANMAEREFSTLNSPRAAKVLYADPIGSVLVMERAERTLKNETKNTRNFFRLCKDDGLPVDPTPHNIGVFEHGKCWKLIDYGNWTV